MVVKYVVASLLLLLISFIGFYKPLYSYLDYLFSPLQFGLNTTANNIRDFTSFYSNLNEVRRDNIRLIEDNLILESRVGELKRLEEENTLLREQLKVQSNFIKDKKELLVNIMGNPTDVTSATVIIDKGARNGISVGDNVIVGNFLIGRVTQVFDIKSVVQLITSPDLNITVYNLDSPEKTEGIVTGRHGFSVMVEKILPSERLLPGDMFATSGKDGNFYPGLYIGKVTQVNEDASQPLKSATLQTIIDYKRIDSAFVLVSK